MIDTTYLFKVINHHNHYNDKFLLRNLGYMDKEDHNFIESVVNASNTGFRTGFITCMSMMKTMGLIDFQPEMSKPDENEIIDFNLLLNGNRNRADQEL